MTIAEQRAGIRQQSEMQRLRETRKKYRELCAKAVSMRTKVESLTKEKERLDWLMGAIQWHTTLSLVHGEVREYRFRTPCITPTIDVRKAIDAAHANPVGK